MITGGRVGCCPVSGLNSSQKRRTVVAAPCCSQLGHWCKLMMGCPALVSPISKAWWGCLSTPKVSNRCAGVDYKSPAKHNSAISYSKTYSPVLYKRADYSKSTITALLNALYKGYVLSTRGYYAATSGHHLMVLGPQSLWSMVLFF